MKIGIFLPNATFDLPGTPEVGGIETFSFTVGEALQKLGHEVVLFGGAPKDGRRHRATTLTLERHPYWETTAIPDLGTRFRRLVQRLHFARSIRAAWDKQRCDAVLLAKPFDWPVAWNWKRARPELRVVMGFHGTDFFATDSFFYRAVDAAFAVSPQVADLAETRVGKRPVLIPNPVDTEFFSPGAETPKSEEDWHIVSSGRLVGWKGFPMLLEAMSRLRTERGIVARLTIAGDGPERAALAAKIAELRLETEVTLAGRLEPAALRDLLRSGDLYALPSIGMEAFSIGALEAGCTGLPLALSDQVGLATYLGADDVLTYPARDVAALTSLLAKFYTHRREVTAVARAGRHARLSEKFSAEQVAERVLALLRG